MSLVRAERRRFFKRRLNVWLLLIGVLILGTVTAGLALTHEKPSAATIAAAEAEAERNYQENLAAFERHRADCEAVPQAKEMGKCEPPPRESFKAEYFMPRQWDFRGDFGSVLVVWAAIMAMVGFVAGATFVGAEWHSGAMMNLLTWRPRRLQVLGTKLAVVLGWMTAIGAVTFAAWTAGLYLVGTISGNTDKMTPGTWQSFGLMGLRGIAMILAFTAVGFGLASIGRHTAFALGVAIAVVIVGQIGLAIVLQLAGVKFMERYLIPTYMDVWLSKQGTLEDWSGVVQCTPTGCDAPKLVLTYGATGLWALAGIAALLALAFSMMRRRDVA